MTMPIRFLLFGGINAAGIRIERPGEVALNGDALVSGGHIMLSGATIVLWLVAAMASGGSGMAAERVIQKEFDCVIDPARVRTPTDKPRVSVTSCFR